MAAFHPEVKGPQWAPSPACVPDPCVTAPDPELNVGDVAREVVRLRLLNKQHEELRAALTRGEAQLRRLAPCAVLQFYSYLERHLGDAGLSATVPEALLKLVHCLCAVCGVAVTSHKPEGILNSVRMLLREPHSFTSKLCNMPHVSGDEAQGLTPFLLSNVQYKRVRDKEVNACYEAFQSWLSAFYFFSVVADQVAPTAQELEQQEALLRKLNGQEELVRSKSVPELSPRDKAAPKGRRSLTGRRSTGGDDEDKPGGATPPSRGSHGAHGSGHASPPMPRGSTSPTPQRGNTGVTRRTNAPPTSVAQTARRPSAASSSSSAGAGRMQSDMVLSALRSSKRDAATPPSPVLQSRAARVAPLGVGCPLPAVPERQVLDVPAPSVFRRSTAPPAGMRLGGTV